MRVLYFGMPGEFSRAPLAALREAHGRLRFEIAESIPLLAL